MSQSSFQRPVPALAGRGAYFKESLQPIYSAWLVLPFLVVYELGLMIMRRDVINGGDAIVMRLGEPVVKWLGVSGGLISVVFIVIAFVVWQLKRKGKWQVHPPVLAGMFLESLGFAVLLFLILGFFVHYISDETPRTQPRRRAAAAELAPHAASGPAGLVPCARKSEASIPELRDFVLYCGAGVYEELVFRVLLLGLLMLVFTRLLHMEHAYAAAWSVGLGAIIFAAFHHAGSGGEVFRMNVFLQRLFAGLYFSAVYYNRSFGIAAASHATYDILVGLNQSVSN